MTDLAATGTYSLGTRTVKRMGYGAMQLAGPGVFGPPRDRAAAVAVLRAAIEAGVNHIDTSDYYGPFVTNEIIREALAPYPDELTLVTKVGARRESDGSWKPAQSADELVSGVHDNLTRLGVEQMHVVNLRRMDDHGVTEPTIEVQLEALARLRQDGKIGHIGLSNVDATQIAAGRAATEIACVQNQYNLAHRGDDALVDQLAEAGIAFVPFFPLGGFAPLQSASLNDVAERVGATPLQVALAWLLQRSPNILLIPGTSSLEHLKQNLAAAELVLPAEEIANLDRIDGCTPE